MMVGRFLEECINKKKLTSASKHLSPNFAYVDYPPAKSCDSATLNEYLKRLFELIPDLRVRLSSMIGNGPVVVSSVIFDGNQVLVKDGEFFSKPVHWEAHWCFHVDNGLIHQLITMTKNGSGNRPQIDSYQDMLAD